MRLLLIMISIGLVSSYFSFALDTLSYNSKELVVDTTYLRNREYSNMSHDKIIITDQERATENSISEILENRSGLYIRDYGGYGGIKQISFRGTYASQNVILLNGMRINSSQNSTVDLSLIPSSIISDVEIVKGGVSSLHGSNGIGGALDIKLNDEVRNSIDLNYSSFNTYRVGLDLGKKYDKNSFQINYSRISSQGDYHFDFIDGQGNTIDTVRNNADHQQDMLCISHKYLNENKIFTNNIIYGNARRGAPGAVLRNNIERQKARLNNQDLIINNSFNYFNDESVFSINTLLKYSEMNYHDPAALLFGNNENYYTTDADINFNYENKFGSSYLKFKLDLNYDRLESDLSDLTRQFYIVAFNTFYDKVLNKRSSFSSSLRLEQNSLQFNYSPAVNYSYDLNFIKTRFSYSYNFRTPNFNELYFPYFGNSDLKPERSHSLNLTLNKEINELKLNLDLFLIDTKDLIIARPIRPNLWSVFNVSSADIKGFELNARYDSFINLELSLTYQIPVDRSRPEGDNAIPYTPQILSYLKLSRNILGLDLSSDLSFTGVRYSGPSKLVSNKLDEYILWDIQLGKQINIYDSKMFLAFELRNILDQRYEVIKNYPMPGVNYRAIISCIF